MYLRTFVAFVACVTLLACGEDDPVDTGGGTIHGSDATSDTNLTDTRSTDTDEPDTDQSDTDGADTGPDASQDSGPDTGPDANINYQLEITPSYELLTLQPGTASDYSVTVSINDYDDDITVSATGLPNGVTVDDAVGPAGTLTLGFTADSDATPGGPHEVTLTADGPLSWGTVETTIDVVVLGATGDKDSSYGQDGAVTEAPPTASGSAAGIKDLVVDDHKVVAVGTADISGEVEGVLARFNADGSVDASFGTDGFSTLDPGTGVEFEVEEMALDSQGRIVVAGTIADSSSIDFCVARTDADGTIDTTFGTDGFARFSFGAEESAVESMAVEDDDQIVVGGEYSAPGTAISQWALARFDSDGSLDTGFGTDGSRLIDVRLAGSGTGAIHNLEVDADGKILASGTFVNYNADGGTKKGLLARFDSDGSFDSTFGLDGKRDLDELHAQSPSMALQSSGRILVWISWDTVEAYNSNGVLDSAWGTAGVATLTHGGFAIATGPEDRLYVAGSAFDSGQTNYGQVRVSRLTEGGSADNNFGTQTFGISELGSDGQVQPSAIGFMADERVVLGGFYTKDDGGGVSERGYFLTRFWP